MLTAEALRAAGYQQFGRDACAGTYAEALWQKRVRDAAGATCYFIDVFGYDTWPGGPIRRWEPRFCLQLEDEKTIMITCLAVDDVATIETLAAWAYERLGAVPWEE